MQIPTQGTVSQATEGSGGIRPDQCGTNPGPTPVNVADDQGSLTVQQQAEALSDPVTFALTCCLKRLDQWQLDVLAEARRPCKVACVGANGIGKTVLIAVLVLYFLSAKPNCRVIITSGVGHQLGMFKEHLAALLRLFPGWELKTSVNELHAPKDEFGHNKAKWFTTERGGLAKGQHSVVEGVEYSEDGVESFASGGGTIVMIRDECPEIPYDIKVAGDTYKAQYTFNFGNSAIAAGWWYELFQSNAAGYKLFTVTAWDSSYWSPKEILDFQTEHGAESDASKIALHAQFVSASPHSVITLTEFNECQSKRDLIEWRHDGIRVGGLDVSAANGDGDECVLSYRIGNRYFAPYVFVGYSNYMELCGSIVTHCLSPEINLDYLYVDNGGAGSPVIDVLGRMIERMNGKLKLIRVNFGGKPQSGHEQYENRATEMAFNLKRLIHERLIKLPESGIDKLRAQCTSREFKVMEDGGKKLERKADQKKRIGHSPDHFDSYLLASNKPSSEITAWKTHTMDYHLKQMEGGNEEFDRSKYNTSPGGHIYGGV